MALEKTWRWFGPSDPIKLADLKQIGVEGVVTSLHHIKNGEVWSKDGILKLKGEIESYGMRWSVVESLPVHEDIKIGLSIRDELIDKYMISLRNLGECGIDTVCYNFMPVLDWARTDLHFTEENGAESMLFDYPTFAAFDVFLLERPNAEKDYSKEVLKKAQELVQTLSKEEQERLLYNIIVVTQGFINSGVGDAPNYKELFLAQLKRYEHIGRDELRENLSYFLQCVVPVAEDAGVNLCIHPDDPPFPLLGLPRIASTIEDFEWIMNQHTSLTNGITYCTGSLSARRDNDLVKFVEKLGDRIHFVHLRNTMHLDGLSFYESGHLEGSVDMYSVLKALLEEQHRRIKCGRKDIRMPFRPDHGLKILDDFNRQANPGYPLIGRLKGFSEIKGLEMGIERNLKNE